MFGFDRPEDGAYERYWDRKWSFMKAFRRLPLVRYYAWWVVHNCIAHPLIGLMPFVRSTFAFHDWTSRKMHPSKAKRTA